MINGHLAYEHVEPKLMHTHAGSAGYSSFFWKAGRWNAAQFVSTIVIEVSPTHESRDK